MAVRDRGAGLDFAVLEMVDYTTYGLEEEECEDDGSEYGVRSALVLKELQTLVFIIPTT